MTEATSFGRFKSELNSFFGLILANLVFGAMAMAFGLQFIVGSVLGQAGLPASPEIRILAGALALVTFGLGLAWIEASARIMKGIRGPIREFRHRKEPVPEEILTCGIIGMISVYREHRTTVRRMILVCTLGGWCFFILGIVNATEFLSLSPSSGTVMLNVFLLIPAAFLTLGVGVVSLLSSYYFSKFSKAWDLRLAETARSEDLLEKTIGTGKE